MLWCNQARGKLKATIQNFMLAMVRIRNIPVLFLYFFLCGCASTPPVVQEYQSTFSIRQFPLATILTSVSNRDRLIVDMSGSGIGNLRVSVYDTTIDYITKRLKQHFPHNTVHFDSESNLTLSNEADLKIFFEAQILGMNRLRVIVRGVGKIPPGELFFIETEEPFQLKQTKSGGGISFLTALVTLGVGGIALDEHMDGVATKATMASFSRTLSVILDRISNQLSESKRLADYAVNRQTELLTQAPPVEIDGKIEPLEFKDNILSTTLPQSTKPKKFSSAVRQDQFQRDVCQRWAVIIGISDYKDTRIPSLRYASADAKSFYNWIVSPSGGKFAPANVLLFTDREATHSNIKKALFEWLGQALEEDVVNIFFAGHGSPQSPDHPNNLFLLPYDVQYDSIASTGFPMWDIETALKRFIKAKKVVVIADACHSGGIGQSYDEVARRASRSVDVNPISSVLQNLSRIGDGVCVISASDEKQLSQESQEWGGHGVFTYFLLKGLQGEADYNKDYRVTLGELIPYLSEQVRRATKNAQSPMVAGKFDPSLSIGK